MAAKRTPKPPKTPSDADGRTQPAASTRTPAMIKVMELLSGPLQAGATLAQLAQAIASTGEDINAVLDALERMQVLYRAGTQLVAQRDAGGFLCWISGNPPAGAPPAQQAPQQQPPPPPPPPPQQPPQQQYVQQQPVQQLPPPAQYAPQPGPTAAEAAEVIGSDEDTEDAVLVELQGIREQLGRNSTLLEQIAALLGGGRPSVAPRLQGATHPGAPSYEGQGIPPPAQQSIPMPAQQPIQQPGTYAQGQAPYPPPPNPYGQQLPAQQQYQPQPQYQAPQQQPPPGGYPPVPAQYAPGAQQPQYAPQGPYQQPR